MGFSFSLELSAETYPAGGRNIRWYDYTYKPRMRVTQDSVVRINTPVSAGSGIYVAPALILTNAHVVLDSAFVDVRSSKGRSFRAKVYKIFKDVDVALVETDLGNQAYPIRLNRNIIRKGENISSHGFPQGRYVLAKSTGTVIDITECCILHNALMAAGSSGGPLLDEAGELIGINTLLYKNKADRANESDLSIAISIKHILEKVGIGDFTYRIFCLPDGSTIDVVPSDMPNEKVLGNLMKNNPYLFDIENVTKRLVLPDCSYVETQRDMANINAYKILMKNNPELFK